MKPEGLSLNLPRILTAEKEQDDWINGKIFQFACQQLKGSGDNEEETSGIILVPELKKNSAWFITGLILYNDWWFCN